MTKTLDINEVQNRLPGLLALASEGDEIIIEDHGEPLAKVLPLPKQKNPGRRTAGLGKGTMNMSDDFDAELPDEFWGLDKGI